MKTYTLQTNLSYEEYLDEFNNTIITDTFPNKTVRDEIDRYFGRIENDRFYFYFHKANTLNASKIMLRGTIHEEHGKVSIEYRFAKSASAYIFLAFFTMGMITIGAALMALGDPTYAMIPLGLILTVAFITFFQPKRTKRRLEEVLQDLSTKIGPS